MKPSVWFSAEAHPERGAAGGVLITGDMDGATLATFIPELGTVERARDEWMAICIATLRLEQALRNGIRCPRAPSPVLGGAP